MREGILREGPARANGMRHAGRRRGLAILLAWAVAAWYAGSTLGPRLRDATAPAFDFSVFYHAARQVRLGGAVYDTLVIGGERVPDLNHPALAVAMAPMSLLPPFAAYLIWTVLNILAFLAALGMIDRAIGLRHPPWPRPALVALACSSAGFLGALALGQPAGLLTLLLVGGWCALRRGRPLAGGALLGVLVALKPFLALLLVPAVVWWQWRALLGAACGAAGLTLLPLPLIGLEPYRDWLHVLGEVTWYRAFWNVSLAGLLFRLDRDLPRAASWLPSLLAVAVALLAAWQWRRRSEAERLDLLAASTPLLALLASPLGWVHYLPLVATAAAWLLARWSALPWPVRPAAALALLVIWRADWFTARWPLLTNVVTVALLLLLGALFLAGRARSAGLGQASSAVAAGPHPHGS